MGVSPTYPLYTRVVRSLPGYLRLSAGRYAFSDRQGYGITEMLEELPCITSVKTAATTGSILVRYTESEPEAELVAKVQKLLLSLTSEALPEAEPSDLQSRTEIGNGFFLKLTKSVLAFAVRKALLPNPLLNLYTIYRALPYIKLGLINLWTKPKVTVEVLDATAISAALLRGMYGSAGSTMFLLGVSDLLEEYTHARSKIQLEQSLSLQVENVWRVHADGTESSISLADIAVDDIIRVRSGSIVPIDGEVVEGEAAVNEASITGESRLVRKAAGSTVFAGVVVEDGNICVRARKIGADTHIATIVKMVDESERLKASVQSRAERMSDAIVPINFAAFFGVLALTKNLTKAISVLMVDYSCAIKLSTPVAVMSALREAAAKGMIVKGGRYLEAMSSADTIVFDKTGTLTEATPSVYKVMSFCEKPELEILRLSACLEEHFPHSMARAVVHAAKEQKLYHTDELHAEISYVVAHGIASVVQGSRVILGSHHYVFEDEKVEEPAHLLEQMEEAAPGCSHIFLAIDGKLAGALAISDPIRKEAKDAIDALRKLGFTRIVMLTGDAPSSAKSVAEALGIDSYHAQVLPEDKAHIIAELKAAGAQVLMVGDGINDSPALAEADVSVAMVDATDIAREVADITLLHSSLSSLVDLRRLAAQLMQRIHTNYRFIVGFNSALLVAGVAGVLSPQVTSLAHNLSTMSITGLSMRQLEKTPATLEVKLDETA